MVFTFQCGLDIFYTLLYSNLTILEMGLLNYHGQILMHYNYKRLILIKLSMEKVDPCIIIFTVVALLFL